MVGYIYIIRNKTNGKFYLGSTVNWYKRKLRHFNELKKGKHHSIYLQRAFRKYGECNFEFIIVETCYKHIEREQFLFDQVVNFKNCYNVSNKASGGDLISNHPNKDEIIKNTIENLKRIPKRKKSYKGDKNPNWRGGKTFCKCGERINSSSKNCSKCQDKSGENNPFYNKTHSKETKDFLSSIRRGNYNGNQEVRVLINKIEYKSLSEASRVLDIPTSTILFRIKSRSKKFINYLYKNYDKK